MQAGAKTSLIGELSRGFRRWAALKLVDPYMGARIVPGANRITRRGIFGREHDVEKLVEAFNSIVFACIHARAKEVASKIKFLVKQRVNQTETRLVGPEHPLVTLLANPNPYFTNYTMWYLCVTYLDLTGRAYYQIGRDGAKTPRVLWPIPSQIVTDIPGDTKKGEPIIKEYAVCWGQGEETIVPAADMLHLRVPDPADPYFKTISLVMKAAVEIDIVNFIKQEEYDLFKYPGPNYVVQFDEVLDKTVRNDFYEQWLEKFHGKREKVATLEGGAKIETMIKPEQMKLLEAYGINVKDIQAVTGVPDSKIMRTENLEARATVDMMEYAFEKETIDPLKKMISEQLTKDLAAVDFDARLVIEHVSTIPIDKKAQVDLDKEEIGMGKVSINEVRKRDGLEAIAGGDEPLVSALLVPLSTTAAAPATDTTATPGKTAKRLTETLKMAIWKSHDQLRNRYELKLSRALKAYFNEIRDDVLRKIRANRSLEKDAEADAFMFDIDKWIARLRQIMSEQSLAMLKAAFDEFIRRYSIDDVVFAPNSPGVQHAIARVNGKTVTVPKTLHEELFKTLNEGIQRQETVEQLSDRVSRFFNNTNDFRSIRIARTVSNFAVNEGNKIAATDSGLFEKKVWITQRDDRVRDLHADIDGKRVTMDERFKLANGDELEVPGDPRGKPESTINCRCTVLFEAA